MALSDRLDLYLKLESLMLDLEVRNDPFEDNVRELMDPIWYSLSEEEHKYLDGRGDISWKAPHPILLVVPDLFRKPPELKKPLVEVEGKEGTGRRLDLKECELWAA